MTVLLRALNGVLMTLLLCVSSLAAAQPPGTSHIQPQLEAESMAPAPGGQITLALVMRTEQGWHGYWENPGDAGLGLRIDWVLPAGLRVSAPRYPVPERLIVAGLMNHVFNVDHALLMTLDVPANAKVGEVLQLTGKGRWLACTETICVPEQGQFTLRLTVGDGRIDPTDRAQFDGYRAKLPRPLGQQAQWAQSGDIVRLAVPFPAASSVAQPWFYARSPDLIAYAAPQSARRIGDMLVLEMKASAGATPGTTAALEGVLALGDGLALDLTAVPGDVPGGGTSIGATDPSGTKVRAVESGSGWSWTGFALALGGALLGGLILNVMPCVFPILSLKALSLAKAGGDGRAARREAWAYTGGVLLTCLVLGGLMLALRAGGAQIGWAFQLQDPRIVALLLVLMVAITLNLAGLFELPTLGMGGERAAQGGLGGAFWTGVLAAFVATPCAGPFMASAIGAALVLPAALALAVFAGLALGLAAPFLAIAYVPAIRARLPRPGPWMATLRRIMAVPMALTALALGWLLWRQTNAGEAAIGLGLALAMITAAMLWWIGRRQRAGMNIGASGFAAGAVLIGLSLAGPALLPAASPAGRQQEHTAFNEAQLASLTRAGKPVFLYFTADWCLTCKVNEANAIDRAEVRAAFRRASVTVMAGDWTRADPAITRFLESKGRSGVPLYLYYPAGGAAPRELPQLLTPAMLQALPTQP